MKFVAPLFLTLSIATFAFADNLPTRGRDSDPELNKAIEQLNRDAKAWNARCAVTNSDAEQSWCERERAALEARKQLLRASQTNQRDSFGISFIPKSNVAAYPPVDVYLRLATRGKILKHVTTDSTGRFYLGTFPASVYIMEFRARKTAGIENERFAIQIDGIKAKGQAGGIPAKYLLGGFGVDVETAPATPVKGQVTTGSLAPTKRMVWIPGEIGSGISGHWVEEGSSRQVRGVGAYTLRTETIRKMQDHGDQ